MNKIKSILAVLTLTMAVSISAFAQSQNVSLPSLDGETVSLTGQKGKVVILALGASWLPLSKSQATVINKLSKKYAGRDVVFYFVATDSTSVKSKNYASKEQIETFATRNKLIIPVLRDSDGLVVLKKFGVDQLPSFVVIDKQGVQAAEPYGGLTPEAEGELVTQISQRIDKIL
jgi:peroxiredoxin